VREFLHYIQIKKRKKNFKKKSFLYYAFIENSQAKQRFIAKECLQKDFSLAGAQAVFFKIN
jgi:hypothetical protein